ncbi:hypothetical protein CLIB1444_04S07052 [[Candida] jaroonii]|uniref:Uncharacterized protein n=1 Tax=[Candida] jaroonii TaxID=467808 RepID=A0ACA9Y7R7_9ASCO|nr:hypothetical protein CLIB1444_04S07052 [[Candida] jaroonii]
MTPEDYQVIHSSYLYKKTRLKWQKIWVVLRNCQLSYYKDEKEAKPLKVINQMDLQTFNVTDRLNVYTTKKTLHFKDVDQTWIDSWQKFFNYKQQTEVEQLNTEHITCATDPAKGTCRPLNLSGEYLIQTGSLHKKIHKTNNWKKLDIVLTNRNLYLFHHKSEKIYRNISTKDIKDVIEFDRKKWCLVVITELCNFKFAAKDEALLINWLSAIKTVVAVHSV